MGRQKVTINEDIGEAFQSYFQEIFTRELSLGPAWFDTYLFNFPHLVVMEVAGCEALKLAIKDSEYR